MRRRRGTTLVEIVVATFLMGLFTTLIATTLVLAYRNYHVTEDKIVGYRHAMNALDRIGRRLAMCNLMTSPCETCSDYFPALTYCINKDSFPFCCGNGGPKEYPITMDTPLVFSYPSFGAGGNVVTVAYARQPKTNQIMEWYPPPTFKSGSPIPANATPPPRVLSENIVSLTLTHYPPTNSNGLDFFRLDAGFALGPPPLPGGSDAIPDALVDQRSGPGADAMKRRGNTLLELMIGSLLVFVAGITMATVVASSSHYLLLERRHCLALQAGWQQSQMLMASFFADYHRGGPAIGHVPMTTTGFDPPAPWNCGRGGATQSPFVACPPGPVLNGMDKCYAADDGGLGVESVTVHLYPCPSPSPSATPEGLVRTGQVFNYNHVVNDVTATTDGSSVAFVTSGHQKPVHIYQPLTGGPPVDIFPMRFVPSVCPTTGAHLKPGIQVASGLAWEQNGPCGGPFTTLLTSDVSYDHFHQAVNPLTVPHWQGPGSGMPDLPDGNGYPSGLAIDNAAGKVYCVDPYIRGIWVGRLGGGWQIPLVPQPPNAPLIKPSQIALDSGNQVLWITDPGDIGLRSFVLGMRTWSPIRRFPSMGSPRGVAVDGAGTVYTADATSLYSYSAATQVWNQVPLPPTFAQPFLWAYNQATSQWVANVAVPAASTLQYQVNSMFFDKVHGLLYITTDTGALIEYQPPGGPGGACPVPGTFVPIAADYDPSGYPGPCAPCPCPCPLPP